MGQQQNTPDSPILAAFLIFDSTTGVLAPGSWGGSVVVAVADQRFTCSASLGTSGPGTAGDTFVEVSFSTSEGAGYRSWLQNFGGGDVSVRIIDAAGALATLPANTRVIVRMYRRNTAIG